MPVPPPPSGSRIDRQLEATVSSGNCDMAITDIELASGTNIFGGRFEHELAPKTWKAFTRHTPFRGKIVHVCRSGAGGGEVFR